MTKLSLLLFIAGLASGQQTAAPASSSSPGTPPIDALYRMFLRHVIALETAADQLDAQSRPGGSELRNWYQNTLLLSPQDTATLKQNASTCVQQLNQQDAQAAQVIASALAAGAGTPTSGAATPPSELAQLQAGRTTIANACIQALRTGLTALGFASMDVFVRTAVARHFSATQPPLVAPAPSGGGK